MSETTLGAYMAWIARNGGHCQSGLGVDDAIGMVPVIKIVAASGRHVVHPSANQAEVLSPSIVEYYDRRLCVLSPFRSTERG